MNFVIDENIENYVKQINGMVKYCSNKLSGSIDITKLSQATGVSEDFIRTALEIMENIESIKIEDVDKIIYLKPFNFESFKQDSLYEILEDEFLKILNFKKNLLNCEIKEIEDIVYQTIK